MTEHAKIEQRHRDLSLRCRMGDASQLLADSEALAIAEARLAEYDEIESERPAYPCYWNMHHRAHLQAEVKRLKGLESPRPSGAGGAE